MHIRPMRSLLLGASESQWLRRHAPTLPFIRKAVTRFMPGENVEDALEAAAELRERGMRTVLTELGENVTDINHADEVARHYLDALTKVGANGLDCHISVKLTQLGLDVDATRCVENLRSLAAYAQQLNTFVWIDMEQHTYVDATLDAYRMVLADFRNVGVCLQSSLYRTAKDLTSLIPLGGGVRLVKGAYREGADVAYPEKRDVDDHFLALAKLMVAPETRASGLRTVFGTHDSRLIHAITEHLAATGQRRESVEFHLLFGIQRAEQQRLVCEGYRVRVLISYGKHWFPWYMRRLAERPANVWFVAKSILSRQA